MAFQDVYNRRIRATKDVSDDEENIHMTSESPTSPSALDPANDNNSLEDGNRSQSDSDGESVISDADAANVSFGALVKAQESMGGRSRRHDQDDVKDQGIDNAEARERKAGKSDNRERIRSSKHAPVEMSSKKAVSRRREVVPTPKRDVRDPRFEPTSGPLDAEKAKKNYGFLAEYRDSEISKLKAGIRQTKDLAAKEKLKRALLSMESRKQTQQRKDQEQEVLRAHRAKEKELIRQGKKPFYLKTGEQKKLALVQRFEGMEGKQVDKVIERRRKKKAQRERRSMPEGRRAMDG